MFQLARRWGVLGLAALLIGGCDDSAASPDGGMDAVSGADCAAIEELPPIITVVDASDGAPVCDPTFTVELSGDPNAAVLTDVFQCDGSSSFGCPTFPANQPQPCVFALNGLAVHAYTLEVSAPGYAASQIAGVTGGQGGCVPYLAPTQLTVALSPQP